MSKKTNDIADNEIRIITAYEPKVPKKRRFFRIYLPIIALVVVVLGIIGLILVLSADNDEENLMNPAQEELLFSKPIIEYDKPTATAKGYVDAVDTVINKTGLLILYPENLRPRLVLGSDMLNDSTILLATQAADVRKDNGDIAGTFVMKGEILSKGEAKAGFCSIINEEITVGVSDATPMLEQTLMQDGYFFRQYPLVVGGQIVENKPKGKAIRKALAELDGKICVVMSKERLTFHDFSQLLVDLGVRNAIYLTGATSYGFYINETGNKIYTGTLPKKIYENINFIIWEKP